MPRTSNAGMEVMLLDSQEGANAGGMSQTQSDREMLMPNQFFESWLAAQESSSHSNPKPQKKQASRVDPIESLQKDNAHHYRDPQKIPGVKPATYVYPHADEDISVAHQKRFPVIMDIFQQNLNEHKKLSLKHPTKTEFKLKMCGTGVDDAKPSILVSHPRNSLKMGLLIMKVLSSPQVREQYDSSRMVVRFRIYLFLAPSFTYLGRPMDGLSIRMKGASFPGAALVSGDTLSTISTIACGLRVQGIDSPFFALTSAHAFVGDDESSEINTDSNEIPGLLFTRGQSGSEDRSESEYIFTLADVEYDMAELMQYDNADEWSQVSKTSDELSTLEHINLDENVPIFHDTDIKPSRVWGRLTGEWEWININLDWALIEIENSEQWQAADISSTIYKTTPGLSRENGRVLVITSRGSFDGIIRTIPTFIANSSNNIHLCEVWSVTLTNSESIFAGDSGALVIDALTKHPYGYVIAINHLRELYVMPLNPVLNQISDSLPSPNFKTQVFMKIIPKPEPQAVDVIKDPLLTRYLFQHWPVDKRHRLSVTGIQQYDLDNTAFYKRGESSRSILPYIEI